MKKKSFTGNQEFNVILCDRNKKQFKLVKKKKTIFIMKFMVAVIGNLTYWNWQIIKVSVWKRVVKIVSDALKPFWTSKSSLSNYINILSYDLYYLIQQQSPLQNSFPEKREIINKIFNFLIKNTLLKGMPLRIFHHQ